MHWAVDLGADLGDGSICAFALDDEKLLSSVRNFKNFKIHSRQVIICVYEN